METEAAGPTHGLILFSSLKRRFEALPKKRLLKVAGMSMCCSKNAQKIGGAVFELDPTNRCFRIGNVCSTTTDEAFRTYFTKCGELVR